MKDFQFDQHSLNPKTRILVCSKLPAATQLLLYVLDFHGKKYDFFSGSGTIVETGSDFLIANTSDFENVGLYKPNIILVTKETSESELASILSHISSGGVLIFPHHLEDTIETTNNYFRKIAFEPIPHRKYNNTHLLSTEIGEIPLQWSDSSLIENLSGINLLCRQFGVMDEDFYEAIIDFK